MNRISILLITLVCSCLLTHKPAAGQIEVTQPVVSHGSVLQSRFYSANTCSPSCPTMLLIPGFPGSEVPDVLGLGSRLSQRGIHVLVVNPRGLHQSEGMMSFNNALDDIKSSIDWLYNYGSDSLGIDTNQLIVGGHSFGGGMVMAHAARDSRVKRVVCIAGTDHGVFIRLYEGSPEYADWIGGYIRSALAPAGPARFDYDETIRELSENQSIFGLQENAPNLANRSILLIGGWEDTNTTMEDYMLPLYRSLKGAGADDVNFVVYHDNHGFGTVRDRLADDIRDWTFRSPAGE